MENTKKENEQNFVLKQPLIQWHLAFYGAAKTEFAKEEIPLEYREEHSVTKKPLKIDLIVIQKMQNMKLKNTIEYIFRTFNIMEYKGPDDYLSEDDFYKVYAYACIFKSDSTETILTQNGDSVTTPKTISAQNAKTSIQKRISAEEITITLVSCSYPKALFSHFINVRHYTIEEYQEGIYYIRGDFFPIQVIILNKLDTIEHAWLKSLSKDVDIEVLDHIMADYKPDREKNENKDVVVNAVIKGNLNQFKIWKEAHIMSEALLELFQDEINAAVEERVAKIANERADRLANERADKLANERADKLMDERIKSTKKTIIFNMLQKQMSYEDISAIVSLDINTIKQYETELLATSPKS